MSIYDDILLLQQQMAAVQSDITTINSNISAINSALDSLELNVNDLGAEVDSLVVKNISVNADLNDLTEGKYCIPDYDTCVSISNRPDATGQTAYIDVMKAGSTGQLIMIYRSCIKEYLNMYARVYYSNGWGDWLKLNDDTGWKTLNLSSGWSNPYGNDVAKYRKIGNVVYLRGLINGTAVAGNTIATLPEGYRPNGRYQRIICCKDQANTVPIEIAHDGVLSDYTKNTSTGREFISLYGMCWVVD